MVIGRVKTKEDMEAAWAVRKEVFVDEQNVPIEEELDDLDHAPTTIHVLAEDEHGPAGTGRVLVGERGRVHLGRICIVKRLRGTGLGKSLMAALEQAAFDDYAVDGALVIELSAQVTAQPFYERLGYGYADGREYLDAGIWHRDMIKTLTAQGAIPDGDPVRLRDRT